MKPAINYPSNIFKQTTPDEEQALTDNPRFQTWYKGWLTRSEIYERKLPDGLTSALRIDGPGDSAFSLDDKGNIRILTGKRDPEKGAGSGVLGIKTWGQQQIHNERSNLQYNYGSDDEKQALNIICYGDHVENVKGGTRYIYATKIILSATSELVLEGGSIKLQSESDIEMAAASINTAQVNKKDIVLGEKKTDALGTDTTDQFDPRATQTFNSPGNLQRNVAGDYNVTVGGCYHSFAAGGPGGLIVDRVFGYYAGTSTNAALGGTLAAGVYSSGEMDLIATTDVFVAGADFDIAGADFDITAAKIDAVAADVNLDAAKVDILGSGDVSITSSGTVRITGTLIYLN